MPKYLGLKPPRLGAIQFQYKTFVETVKVPAAFGHVTSTINWHELGNDKAGCCAVAGAGHETMLWTRAGSGTLCEFDEAHTLADYRAASGWNGVPNDQTDVGLDMQEFAERRRTIGIHDAKGAAHKIKGYAALESVDEILQAAYLFGAAGVGIWVTDTMMSQFDQGQIWTAAPYRRQLGGHYVPVVGRNSKGNIMLITWGKLHAATPEFMRQHTMQAVGYLSREYLMANGKSPELLDEAKLDSSLAELGA